jgi:hypothetical protein
MKYLQYAAIGLFAPQAAYTSLTPPMRPKDIHSLISSEDLRLPTSTEPSLFINIQTMTAMGNQTAVRITTLNPTLQLGLAFPRAWQLQLSVLSG